MKQVRGMTKLLQLKQDMIAIKFTDGDIQRVFNGKTGSATRSPKLPCGRQDCGHLKTCG